MAAPNQRSIATFFQTPKRSRSLSPHSDTDTSNNRPWKLPLRLPSQVDSSNTERNHVDLLEMDQNNCEEKDINETNSEVEVLGFVIHYR